MSNRRKINILLTSVGRRSYLVNYFKKALDGMGEVHVANSSDISPAFQVADYSVVTPIIYDSEYIPFLLKYCLENKIRAVISLFDIDLPVLAENKHKFEKIGTTVIVSDKWIVDICNDKWKTNQFLIENGINVPKTFLNIENVFDALQKHEIKFPLIIKPRWGMGSIAVFEAENIQELKIFYEKTKRNIMKTYLKYESKNDIEESVIIQEKLSAQEYGLDIINDLDGNYKNTIVKMKYAMRSGETDCAVTVQDERLKHLGEKISNIFHHVGNLDVDVFADGENIYVLEMNARFGGGYPFSHMAGVDLPLAIIKWLNGEVCSTEILTERINYMAQKDINLVRLQLKSKISIDKIIEEGELYDAIEMLESKLSPSLKERKIDICEYSNKLFINGKNWIAKNKRDEIIGILAAYINDNEQKVAYLSILVVKEEYRGLGIAKNLIETAEKEAQNLSFKKFRLEVRKQNFNAIRFYERNGYKIVSDATSNSFYMEKLL